MELSKRYIITISIIAMAGSLMGVLADLFSAWSSTPSTMSTAISIDIESIKGLYLDKPRWTYVLGNYLGVFFIPFHWFGFFLVHLAIKPAGKLIAIIFLIMSCYVVAIGAGFHGTLAFIADTISSGNNELLVNMMEYWQVWGALMIFGYVAVSTLLFVLIVSGWLEASLVRQNAIAF